MQAIPVPAELPGLAGGEARPYASEFQGPFPTPRALMMGAPATNPSPRKRCRRRRMPPPAQALPRLRRAVVTVG